MDQIYHEITHYKVSVKRLNERYVTYLNRKLKRKGPANVQGEGNFVKKTAVRGPTPGKT
jgi:hypothetical protein